jgi:hypothetical protein
METPAPLHRSIFAVDIQRYSARHHPLDQVALRRDLRDLLRAATTAINIDRDEWHLQDRGDGELALVPASISKPLLVAEFVRELHVHLTALNRPRRTEERVRLRVAMHHGDVIQDGTGFAGGAIVAACRLLDSDPVRAALDRIAEADLAVILSDRMFEDVNGYRDLHRRYFRQVEVTVKEFTGRAWVWVPGFQPPDLSTPAPASDGPGPDRGNGNRSDQTGDRRPRERSSTGPSWQGDHTTVQGPVQVGDQTYNVNEPIRGVPILGNSWIGKLVREDDEEER